MKKAITFILCTVICFGLMLPGLNLFPATSTVVVAATVETAKPTSSSVMVDGVKIAFTAYNIEGNNYFKLRDLAVALGKTPKHFSVSWDGQKNEISLKTGQAYEAIGGELIVSGDETNQSVRPTKASLYYDNLYAEFQAYVIHGHNYFKLRDIARIIDFGVAWEAKQNSILIDTSISYKHGTSANYPSPFEKGYFTGLNNPIVMAESMGVTFSADKEMTFMIPYDANVDRSILVENKGKHPVFLEWSISSSSLGLEHDDLMSHPQPGRLILEAGDQNVILTAYQYYPSNVLSEDATFNCNITVTDPDTMVKENLQFDLKNQIIIHSLHDPLPANATVSGRILDKSTGQPLANLPLELSDGNFRYRAHTNTNGDYQVSVYAYKNMRGFYNEFTITANSNERGRPMNQAPGQNKFANYSQERGVIAPKPGDTLKVDMSLGQKAKELNYSVDTVLDIGVQAYDFDATSDGSIIASVPFHTGFPASEREKYAYMHVFNYKGDVLFKKHLAEETPAVDVSKDGTLIATTIQDSVHDLFNKAIVYDQQGQIYYKSDFMKSISPFGTIRSRIWSVQISDNNRFLAFGDVDGTVWLADMVQDKIVWSDYTGTGQVRKLAFDRNDTVLYVSSGDGFLRCYSVEDGDILWKAYVDAWVTSIGISKNYIVTMSKAAPCYIHIIDKYTGEDLVSIPVTSGGAQIAISPDESLVWYGNSVSSGKASLSNNLYDIQGNMKFSFEYTPGRQAAFSADSSIFVFYSNRSLGVVNREGQILWEEEIVPNGGGDSVASLLWISPDGKYIIAGMNNDPSNRFWGQIYFLSRK